MDNGFKIVPDVYKRGNGRWAKVTRLHDKATVLPERFKGDSRVRWIRKYSVAFGRDGEYGECRTYRLKTNALAFAQMYIEDETIVD
jgi:hypothetical protein